MKKWKIQKYSNGEALLETGKNEPSCFSKPSFIFTDEKLIKTLEKSNSLVILKYLDK